MKHFPARTALLPIALALGFAQATVHAQQTMPHPAPIPVASDGPLGAVETRHHIGRGKGRIAYRATWFEYELKDASGSPQATISATAYVRDGGKGGATRPVMFLFNGGPGASSSPLHFRGFGPRLLSERDAAGKQTVFDNPLTLLDVADLVFVDPVGTGFSRPLTPGGGAGYWSVDGDARATMALVRHWLATNRRNGSPVYFAGESYGGYRLGTMARDMADIDVAGLVLISPALDFGTTADQQSINALPTLALAAWHHRGASDGRTADSVWEDARRFAQGEYASALQQGASLAANDRRGIAERVGMLTGMDGARGEAGDLALDTQKVLETLVPGSTVGRLDVRVVAPNRAIPDRKDRPAAANDPSLGLGRTNVIVSQPIGAYMRDELKVRTTRDYYSLTLDVNFSWNWTRPEPRPGQSWSVAENIAALMARKPGVRLLVLSGYFDLATPVLGTRYAIDHSAIPRDRTTFLAFPVGHSVTESDDGRALSTDALRKFLVKPADATDASIASPL